MPDPFEAPLGEPSAVSPASKSPLTCQSCSNSPATQAFVVDVSYIGRDTTLVCGPCGDEQEPHARKFGPVWRFRLAPLQEVQSA